MRAPLLAALSLTLLAGAAEARSSSLPAPMREAGTLTCAFDPNLGLVIGSSRGTQCTFERRGRPIAESYSGRFNRLGFDVGLTSTQTIAWRVMTPGGRARPGMLSGTFSGNSAEATVVVGAGTQVLFNTLGERIDLEPVMHSGQAGLGLAFGATGLELRSDSYAILR
ncbi:MAG TPA: DUF992 domain-containing protein [Beijerinckiaceae bacterium]|jgi:hypothetical protein